MKRSVILFALLVFISGVFAQPTDYQSLWNAYEQVDLSYYQDAQKLLDKISGFAYAENNELQLFRVNYERYTLRNRYSNWTTKNHLLFLDGLRKTSPQPYQGLYNYLITNKIISDLDFKNTTPSGKTDLSQYDEWSDDEKLEVAQQHYATGVSQLIEHGDVPAAPFSFLLNASASSRSIRGSCTGRGPSRCSGPR